MRLSITLVIHCRIIDISVGKVCFKKVCTVVFVRVLLSANHCSRAYIHGALRKWRFWPSLQSKNVDPLGWAFGFAIWVRNGQSAQFDRDQMSSRRVSETETPLIVIQESESNYLHFQWLLGLSRKKLSKHVCTARLQVSLRSGSTIFPCRTIFYGRRGRVGKSWHPDRFHRKESLRCVKMNVFAAISREHKRYKSSFLCDVWRQSSQRQKCEFRWGRGAPGLDPACAGARLVSQFRERQLRKG